MFLQKSPRHTDRMPDAASGQRRPDWLEYWDSSDVSLFAGEGHVVLHYRVLAQRICDLIPHAQAVVLDYGPGEALSAPVVAERCGQLVLCEPSPSIRNRLRHRFAGHPNISVIGPDQLDDRLRQAVDLTIVNSVIQYLRPEDLQLLLANLQRLLAAQGRLIVGDVPPPGRWGMLHDVLSLLWLAWDKKFLPGALKSLVATLFSPYRAFLRSPGLHRYSEKRLLELLRESGLEASRAPRNLGHNPHRMTFLAQRSSSQADRQAQGSGDRVLAAVL